MTITDLLAKMDTDTLKVELQKHADSNSCRVVVRERATGREYTHSFTMLYDIALRGPYIEEQVKQTVLAAHDHFSQTDTMPG